MVFHISSIWNELIEQLKGNSNIEYVEISKSGIVMYFETIENICFSIKVFNGEFSFKV